MLAERDPLTHPPKLANGVSPSLRSLSEIGRNNIPVATAQQLFSSDPKYKKYTQQVEKCLNAFDNVHEWADCTAFLRLKQLLKVRMQAQQVLLTNGLV